MLTLAIRSTVGIRAHVWRRSEPAAERVSAEAFSASQILAAPHPLADALGAFADDPGWELMMDAIHAQRAKDDADLDG